MSHWPAPSRALIPVAPPLPGMLSIGLDSVLASPSYELRDRAVSLADQEPEKADIAKMAAHTAHP